MWWTYIKFLAYPRCSCCIAIIHRYFLLHRILLPFITLAGKFHFNAYIIYHVSSLHCQRVTIEESVGRGAGNVAPCFTYSTNMSISVPNLQRTGIMCSHLHHARNVDRGDLIKAIFELCPLKLTIKVGARSKAGIVSSLNRRCNWLHSHSRHGCLCLCCPALSHADPVVKELYRLCYTMKNAVFWDVTPCRSCKYRRSGWT
jgi:hypothetical protein